MQKNKPEGNQPSPIELLAQIKSRTETRTYLNSRSLKNEFGFDRLHSTLRESSR